jgi:hypothetical protein
MIKYFLLFVLIAFFCPAQAVDSKPIVGKSCMLTKSLRVDDLVDKSGKIFVGKFLYAEEDRVKGLDIRKMHFQLIEPIKGVKATNNEIVIKEWARMKSPFLGQVKKNKKYVFFFYEDSARGLSSLVGFDQGFAIVNQSNQLEFSKRVDLKTRRIARPSFSALSKNMPVVEVNTLKDLKDLCQDSSI